MHKKLTIIIVTGLPATGKTTLSKKIAKQFSLPLLSKDAIKESLFNSLGTKDRQWSKELGVASYQLLFQLAENLLAAGTSFILEAPLQPKYDNERFVQWQQRYRCQYLQILCQTQKEVLVDRFIARAKSDTRHPGHAEAEHIDDLRAQLMSAEQKPLSVSGEVHIVDTTNFAEVQHDSIAVAVQRLFPNR